MTRVKLWLIVTVVSGLLFVPATAAAVGPGDAPADDTGPGDAPLGGVSDLVPDFLSDLFGVLPVPEFVKHLFGATALPLVSMRAEDQG